MTMAPEAPATKAVAKKPAVEPINENELFVQLGLLDFGICDKRCNGRLGGNHKMTFKFIIAPEGVKLSDLPREFSKNHRLSHIKHYGDATSDVDIKKGIKALSTEVKLHARGQSVKITYDPASPYIVTDRRHFGKSIKFYVMVIDIAP